MHRLFGKKHADGAPGPVHHNPGADDTRVMQELQDRLELIEKREAHLQRKVDQELAEALKHKNAGRKNAAMGCLKRKKMVEAELESLFEQRMKLDTQEHTLSALKFSANLQGTEKRATSQIARKIADMGGIDKMQDQKDKTEEVLQDAYEALGVAAQPLANPAMDGMDDDELWAEMEALEKQQVEDDEPEKLAAELARLGGQAGASSSGAAQFAAAPQGQPKMQKKKTRQEQAQEDDERELAELDKLAASMNLEVAMPTPMPMMAAPAMIGVM